jgi:hypothetical protein
MNAAKSGESAAAQNVRQDSFGLIVGSMRDSDSVQSMFARALRQKSITEPARRRLQISFITFGDISYRGGREVKRQFMFARQGGDKFFVVVSRSATKFVIEMQDAKGNAEVFFESNKEQQQGHRIRATGNRHTHPIAFADEPTTLNGAQQALR